MRVHAVTSVLSNSATPWTVALQAPQYGFLQAEILAWGGHAQALGCMRFSSCSWRAQ